MGELIIDSDKTVELTGLRDWGITCPDSKSSETFVLVAFLSFCNSTPAKTKTGDNQIPAGDFDSAVKKLSQNKLSDWHH